MDFMTDITTLAESYHDYESAKYMKVQWNLVQYLNQLDSWKS